MQNKKFITSKISISILVISVVFIVSAIIFAVWNNNKFKDKIISNTKNNLSVKAEIITTGIEKLLSEHARISQSLSNDKFIINALLHKYDHDFYTEYCPIENIFLTHIKDIDAIMLIAEDGTLVHRHPVLSDSLPVYSSRDDIDYVIQNHREHISGIYSNTGGKPAVAVSYPVFYQSRFVGIIRFTVLVETFIEQFISPALDENTFAIGIDNQGKLFYNPYTEFKAKTIYDLFNEDRAKYPDNDFSKRQEVLIKSVRGESGSAIYQLTDNTGQFTKMIMAYRPINIIDGIYSISLYTNYNNILQPANEYAIKLVAFISLIVLIFIIITIFLFRTLGKQIKLQTEASHFKDIAVKAEKINKQKNEFKALYEEYKNLNTELIIAKEKVEESELKYRTLVENQGEGLTIADLDETIVFANPAAERIFETENLVGRNIREFVTSDQLQLIKNQTQKRVKGEKSTYELDVKLHGDIKKSLLITATPIFENEKVIQTLGLFVDITKRKQAEKALLESESLYRTLVENLPLKIFLKDINSVYISCNTNYAHDLKIEPAEITGKTDYDLYPPEEADKYTAEDRRIINSGKTEEFEEKYFLSQRKKWVNVIKTVCKSDNNIIGILGIFWDITDRKNIELNLKKSQKLYQFLFDKSPVSLFEGDFSGIKKLLDNKKKEGITHFKKYFDNNSGFVLKCIKEIKILYLNKASLNLQKAPDKRKLMNNFNEIFNEKTIETFKRVLLAISEGKESFKEETEFINFKNEIIHVIIQITIFENYSRAIISMTDITELKIIEENMIKLSTAVEQSANMVIITDAEGTIEYVNKKFTEVTGYLKEELINKKPNILKSVKHSNEFYLKLWATIKSRNEWAGEIQNKKKNGELYWEFVNIAPVLNNNNEIINFIGIIEDITERKSTEKKIFNAIIKTEEREKKRFAIDLHDGLGPLLSAAKLYIEAIKFDDSLKVENTILKKFEEIINDAITSTQEIANNISPHILKNFGLIAAVNSFCNKISETKNITINVKSNTEKRFYENIETSLYRVLIELINNTMKHANASSIEINIKEEKQDLLIRYMDNGVGFDVKKILDKSKGMGVKNILNRIDFINGKINIKSNLNKGTLIEITIPH